MATLTVLAFQDEQGAARMIPDLETLSKEQMVQIHDGAIVVRPADGKPKVQQLNSLVGQGAWGGAFWGMLIGMLFFMPWLGLGLGAITGALSGKFADIGIDDNFIKEVGGQIAPGTSALFLMTSNATALDKIAERLSAHQFKVLRTNLPAEQEQALRDAFSAS
jgi:uncharacterized membrane protein